MANFWMALSVGLVVFILADMPIIYCSITCRNQEGKSVDWFIIYKLPRIDESPIPMIRDGYAYYYMDVNAPKWTFGKVPINNTGQAVSHTLQQIYDNHKSKDVAYFLYNDETPSKSSSNSHGHTKGDVCFDKFSGFWLVHSVPKFPPDASVHYLYPESGSYFGQMFLCVTYKYSSLDEIGKQMAYIYPEIYDYNLPESFEAANPNLIPVVHGKHVASPPWNRSTTLVSEGGQKFTSFAKFTDFDADLYHDWVAPYYKSDIYVESWLNGIHPMSTNCTGKYKFQIHLFSTHELQVHY
ncbi:hypothetical protein LSH36_258g01004 [Paralvinella palmiformis]|uniref:Uncharacterized protein n=1 Tax=Paralvinella palmiformis TaxID=53620 RepID=A0AAD9N4I5_9ANNE|nr:hypothetical protein LSH36_258g01004 [Paralvinella palmiformis]